MAKYQFASKLMFAIVMHDPIACKKFIELVFPERRVERISFPEKSGDNGDENEAFTMHEIAMEVEKTIITGIESKSVRLDVLFEGDDRVYDIEMQLQPEEEVARRSRYYHMAIARNSLKKGEPYENLKTGCVIFVCCFDPFGMEEPMYCFEMIDRKLDLQLGDGSSTIILNTKCPKELVPAEFAAFFNFVNTNEVDESNEFVSYLGERLRKAGEDEEVDRVMTVEEEMRIQHRLGEKKGRAEGFAEGQKSGIELGFSKGEKSGFAKGEKSGAAQKEREIAKEMLKEGMAQELIAKITGLTLKEIQAL